MLLAAYAARCPGELVCDMAEVYHVLDWHSLGLPLAATLAAGLGEDSRSYKALHGIKVSARTMMMAAIVDNLALLVWAKTVDGQKGRNRPQSVQQLLLGEPSKNKPIAFASAAEYEATRSRIVYGMQGPC